MTALQSILLVALLAPASTGAGLLLIRPLLDRTELNRGERLLFGFGTGSLVLHYLVWGIGSFRYDVTTMSVLFVVWCLAGVIGLRREDLPSGYLAGLARDRAAWPPALIVAGLFLFSIAGSLAPPSDFDSLSYHLANPKMDLELGQIEGRTGRVPQFLLSQLLEHHYRLAMAIVGDRSAQMIHALFGLAAALGAAAICLRLGATLATGLAAAAMFMLVRNVIWESATGYVDLGLAFYFTLVTLALMLWRQAPSLALAALLGIATGAGIMVKYHGFAVAIGVALVLMLALPRRPKLTVGHALVAGFIALLIIAPHLLRNWLLMENPLYPAFDTIFAPHRDDAFDDVAGQFGRGEDLLSFLVAPWDVFINTSRFFDGHQIGAPFLLVFLPFAFLRKNAFPTVVAILSGAYFVLWFFVLSQQVRFLIPVFPLVAVLAALGIETVWRATGGFRPAQAAIGLALAIMLANQAMFAAGYAAIRLPAAAGLRGPADYLDNSPGIQDAFYRSCGWLTGNLQPGERYLALLSVVSYYCPQAPALDQLMPDEYPLWRVIGALKEPAPQDLANALERHNVVYIIRQTVTRDRENATSSLVTGDFDASRFRFGKTLDPVLAKTEPVFRGPFASVWRTSDILPLLQGTAR